jgi:hypothetical protein
MSFKPQNKKRRLKRRRTKQRAARPKPAQHPAAGLLSTPVQTVGQQAFAEALAETKS